MMASKEPKGRNENDVKSQNSELANTKLKGADNQRKEGENYADWLPNFNGACSKEFAMQVEKKTVKVDQYAIKGVAYLE